MKNYTVHEIAKLLDFSQQAVRYQIKNNLPSHMIESRPNGAVCVTEEGLAFLRESMGRKIPKGNESSKNEKDFDNEISKEQTNDNERTSENERTDTENANEMISLLKHQTTILMEQLAVKDEQIASQARQIETLVESLKLAQQTAAAAQALHAGTIQKELNATQPEPAREILEESETANELFNDYKKQETPAKRNEPEVRRVNIKRILSSWFKRKDSE